MEWPVSTGCRVNLVGGRGYAGSALLGLIARHPSLDLGVAASRSHAGAPIRTVCEAWPDDGRSFTTLRPEEIDTCPAEAWVLALPNGVSKPWVEAIEARCPDSVIVDLSADHRFDRDWTYGLPEHYRAHIRRARRIANPGCYATGAQFGLWPLAGQLVSTPMVFGVSGYSGAGSTPSPRNDPEALRDSLLPYALSGHLHEREISSHLPVEVRFMPHVAGFARGITLTIAVELERDSSIAELEDCFRDAYAGEPAVRVCREIPQLDAVRNTPDIHIGGFVVDARCASRATLVVVLDNLLKGAASQAMQNLNLALGLEEQAGIR